MPVKLIAHVLLTVADSHLIIQRSQIKRGNLNIGTFQAVVSRRMNYLVMLLCENALKKLAFR